MLFLCIVYWWRGVFLLNVCLFKSLVKFGYFFSKMVICDVLIFFDFVMMCRIFCLVLFCFWMFVLSWRSFIRFFRFLWKVVDIVGVYLLWFFWLMKVLMFNRWMIGLIKFFRVYKCNKVFFLMMLGCCGFLECWSNKFRRWVMLDRCCLWFKMKVFCILFIFLLLVDRWFISRFGII